MHIDEHTWLKALKEGNKEGLNWLFDQYKKPIFHYCLKLLKVQMLAEEATADVFITIWKKRQIISTNQSIQPFLYKLARDTAYSYLRKVASKERLKKVFLENYPVQDDLDGERQFLQKEYTARVSHIVDALPTQRQLIFRMRYFDGKDNPTIARELNLSIHTVKSQLVKARSYVRQQLELIGTSSAYFALSLLWI